MAIVTVKNKYQALIPQSVREQMDVSVGDLLEARLEKGKITFAPKSVVDRAIAEGLADIKAGRVSGTFDNVEDMLASMKGKKTKLSAQNPARDELAAQRPLEKGLPPGSRRNSESVR